MGREERCLANFASEAVKASNANVLITTTATKTEGGWLLEGEKSFGCLSGTADYYLVTARRADVEGIDGLSLFLVARDTENVRPRQRWNGLGMRASDNHGLIMDSAFVPDDHALTIPGGFTRATQMSRGLVGRQPGRDRRDLRRHRPRRLGVRPGPHHGRDLRRHRQADRLQPHAPGAHRRGRGGAHRGAPVAPPPDRPRGQRPADPAQARGRRQLEARQGRDLRARRTRWPCCR